MRLPDLPIPEGLEYSEEKLPVLLYALGQKPVLLDACVTAKIDPMALEMQKLADPELESKLVWAMNVGFNVVEAKIANRGIGIKTPVVDKHGNIVHRIDPKTGETVVVYNEEQSDMMLKKFAERMRPDLYGDKIDVNHEVKTVTYMPAQMLETEFEKMLELQAQKTADIMDGTLIDAQFEEVKSDEDVEAEVEDLV